MLVGDCVMSMRKMVPDLPATLPACPAPTSVNSPSGGNGTLAPGTYYFVVTQTNIYGETQPSPEQSVTVGASGIFQFNVVLYPGVTAINVYMTGANGVSGSEIYFATFGPEVPITLILISSLPTIAGVPPSQSSAFLPDSDGAFISASTAFTWVSEALKKISVAVGGLLNYSGVATVAGQGLYTIPGQWLNISDVWYNGYWIQGGRRADFFRRNTVTSQILQNVTISVTAGQQCIEVSYQPNRNSGFANTTALMQPTDTLVGITNPSAFLLPFGFAMFGSYPAVYEIVAYYQIGMGVISNMVRGLGNTVAQQWPAGIPVTELSLFWCGKQVFNTMYTPGQSTVPIPVPEEWKTIIDMHVLSEAKKKEQDLKSWKELRDQAFADAEKWMLANKGVTSFVQVGGDNRPIVYADTVAGGLVIPS